MAVNFFIHFVVTAQTRKGMVMLREMLISEEVEKRELLESLLGRLSDHDITFKEILKSSPKKCVFYQRKWLLNLILLSNF